MSGAVRGTSSAPGELGNLEYMSSVFAPGTTAFLKAMTNVFIIWLGWITTPADAALRRDFGERALGWVRLILSYFSMGVFLEVATYLDYAFNPSAAYARSFHAATTVNGVLLLVFFLLACWHRARIAWRQRAGIQWHSYSLGLSRVEDLARMLNAPFPWLRDDFVLLRFVEPGLLYLLGHVVRQTHTIIGVWLLVMAVALFVRNQLIYAQNRGRILDLIDARIEAEYFSKAASGKPKQEAAGMSIASDARASFNHVFAMPTNDDTAATVHSVLTPHGEVQPFSDIPAAAPLAEETDKADHSPERPKPPSRSRRTPPNGR